MKSPATLPQSRNEKNRMSWKTIDTMGEHARYRKQDGVNVIVVAEQIADKQETSDIESNLFKQFEDEAQRNQIRFYRTDQKLSDGGGGVSVYFNGVELMHKALVMGSLEPLVECIEAAMNKEPTKKNEKYQEILDRM